MSQAPYSWVFTGNCPSCGSPIYGRVQKPGQRWEHEGVDTGLAIAAGEIPEARRTCPASCPHGAANHAPEVKGYVEHKH